MIEQIPSQSKFPFDQHPINLQVLAEKMQNGTLESIPEGFSKVDTFASIFSPAEKDEEALDLYHPPSNLKLFLFKSTPEELNNTQLLNADGINEVLPLAGELQVGKNLYVYGSVTGACINIESFSESKDSEYSFGMDHVMQRAGNLLARIHAAGYTHNSFVLSHIILNPDPEQPLYISHQGKITKHLEEQSHDIQTFFESMQKKYTTDQIDRLKRIFLDSYNKVSWKR